MIIYGHAGLFAAWWSTVTQHESISRDVSNRRERRLAPPASSATATYQKPPRARRPERRAGNRG